jgi:hypothetical protein
MFLPFIPIEIPIANIVPHAPQFAKSNKAIPDSIERPGDCSAVEPAYIRLNSIAPKTINVTPEKVPSVRQMFL